MKTVDEAHFSTLKKWYDSYADTMKNGDKQLEDAITLKYEHTCRVIREMELLCESIALKGALLQCARIASLLHDVARFEQFKKYRTFSDRQSEDHARTGCAIIKKKKLLDTLPDEAKHLIVTAIKHHNAVALPETLNEKELLLCRLLRDADKLDIYRIALDHYINPDPKRKDTVQVSIPDGNGITPEVLDGVRKRRIVSYGKVKTVSDFKMIQLGWVYDLNFPHSFACVNKRAYLEDLEKHLPDQPDVHEVVRAAKEYTITRAAG